MAGYPSSSKMLELEERLSILGQSSLQQQSGQQSKQAKSLLQPNGKPCDPLNNTSLTNTDDINQALWMSELHEWNAKKSEALTLANETAHPLLQLRSMIFRGRLSEAATVLQTLSWDQIPDSEKVEILVEKARLEHSQSNWKTAADLIAEALRLSPPGITHMTLCQMMSFSHLEMGNMALASEWCSKAESLIELFPHSTTAPYIQVIKAKIIARYQNPEAGLAHLNKIWASLLASDTLSADAASALLRGETELRRLAGQESLRPAIANFLIESSMGEELYMALAQVDCYYAANSSLREFLAPQLDAAASKFGKIRQLVSEINSQSKEISMSALSFSHMKQSEFSVENFKAALESKFLHLSRQKLLIQTSPWRIFSLTENPRLEEALLELKDGPVLKSALLQKIWNIKAYSQEKHGNLIPSLAYRLKKAMGSAVLSVGEKISFTRGFYVD